MIEVKSDGCRLACDVDGPVVAPALLFLNSLGSTAELWSRQVAAFTPTHRAIRYDTRGHGRSQVPSGEATLEQLSRDAIAVLDALGVDRAHVCGSSLGGMVAMWLGAHAPERVASLTLTSTAARIAEPAFWEDRARQVRTIGLEAMADTAMARWFTPAFRAAQPAIVAKYRRMLVACPPAGYVACCAALRDADLYGDLPRIAAPTLIIVGASDPATPPSSAHAIAAGIRGARVVELEGSHMVHVERADEFNAQVRAFVGSRGD